MTTNEREGLCAFKAKMFKKDLNNLDEVIAHYKRGNEATEVGKAYCSTHRQYEKNRIVSANLQLDDHYFLPTMYTAMTPIQDLNHDVAHRLADRVSCNYCGALMWEEEKVTSKKMSPSDSNNVVGWGN